jgi:3-oxoadipate enol-lactonase
MNRPVVSSAGSANTPDGLAIAYTFHAASLGDGPPRPRIVLIHSLALDRSIWDGVVPLLTPHADVVAYDCRGHGKSGRPKMKFTPELFAEDLAKLLHHLKWPRVMLAGCSMGGCVAQAFAGIYPDSVQALL